MILPFKKKRATKVQTLKSKPQEVKVPTYFKQNKKQLT